MKKLLLLPLLWLPMLVMAQTKQLNSFDELMEAMKQGQKIQAVFHYKDCQLISGNEISDKSVDAIGGMPIDTWEYFAEGAIRNKEAFVVMSIAKLIANPKGKGYVHNYVKVRVYASNKVKITANYIDALSFEETMTENFFTTMNDGNEGAAYFYVSK